MHYRVFALFIRPPLAIIGTGPEGTRILGGWRHNTKGSYNNRIFIVVVLSGMLFSFAALNGCARLNQGSEEGTGAKNKMGKEILVAEDISRGHTVYMPVWCGNNAILFKSSNDIELIDISSKEKVKISIDPKEWPLNCTPDGRWVFYYRSVFIPNPAYEEYEGTDENPYQSEIPMMEVYGYEVATGKRQRFAATDDMGSSTEWVSPDGKKISLRPWHHSVKAEAGPWPDAIWFSNKEWSAGEFAWFKDSSGMAAFIWYGIGVEFFGDGGWAKGFEVWTPGVGVSSIKTDRENRIYFVRTESALEMSEGILPQLYGNYLLNRCSIKSRELVCEKILARKNLALYEILPDGNILFDLIYEQCIRRASPGATDEECVIGNQYGHTNYDKVYLIGLSPDGRRLAFKRLKNIARFKGTSRGDDYLRYDLFLINITGD